MLFPQTVNRGSLATVLRFWLLVTAVTLAGCAGRAPIHEVVVPVGYYPDIEQSILNSRRVSSATRAALDEDVLFKRRCPDSFGRVIAAKDKLDGQPGSAAALAEVCIREARRMQRQGEPARAAGLYLAAVQVSAAEGKPSKGSRELSLHNHATAHLAELLAAQGTPWQSARTIETPLGMVELTTHFTGEGLIDPRAFDSLQAADSLLLNRKLFPTRRIQEGTGGALAAFRHVTPEMLKKHPFMPPVGQGLPVTATIGFTAAHEAALRFHNIFISDRTRVEGRDVVLAADFSAPLGKLMSYAPRENVGFRGMLRPAAYFDMMGLFTLGPVRRDRIPLIFVHGLNSRPATWLQPTSALITDRQIRENYQLWYYRYPTGIPLAYSAAGLRRELDAIRDHYGISPKDTKLNDVVMVGHSMGGLLTSLQIRTSKQGIWNQYFSDAPEKIDVDAATRKQIEEMFLFEARPYISRAVFISTPHRGSPAALGPIGKLLESLIRLPADLILFRQPEVLQHTRELGRVLLTNQRTSVNNLRENNPVLQTILDLPVNPRVTIHSIIGDRGKRRPLKMSSDGIVPYRSSHLDVAVSEKVVPAGHSAHHHPEAIEELRRILLLHLQ